MESLNFKQRYIIENRYGLKGISKKTLAEIGENLDLTKERIRQIEKSVKSVIKKKFPHLKEYI